VRPGLTDPGLLARSLVAMYVVMPLIVVGIAYVLDLNHALEVALVLLALSPVPPILPKKEIEAGGSTRYVLGLLAVASLVAIVVVPGGIALIGPIFGQHVMIPVGITTKVVATSVLLPLIAGFVIAHLAPQFAKKVAGPLASAATVLLVVLFLPTLFVARHAIFAQFGNFTILAIAIFTLIGLAVGHLLGGPIEGDRTALALATATRHPGVALAILHVVSPQDPGIGPVVLLYLLVGGIVSLPYVIWRKRLTRAPA
jgi:BASS family bile acid:Na+ symporter